MPELTLSPQLGIYEYGYCLLSGSSPVQNEKLFRIRRAIGITVLLVRQNHRLNMEVQ
jgi:hypothetical protein